MNDESVTIAQLKRLTADFVAERDWQKYHRPKNLAMSIAIEAAELMELFQWADLEESDALVADAEVRGKLSGEMADVLSFLLSLSNVTGIDLAASFEAKMGQNSRKYPVEESRGHYERPDR
jgi:NTP pyrophosphatase (non-canonical NTP hydrolase)